MQNSGSTTDFSISMEILIYLVSLPLLLSPLYFDMHSYERGQLYFDRSINNAKVVASSRGEIFFFKIPVPKHKFKR